VLCKTCIIEQYNIKTASDKDASSNCGKESSAEAFKRPSYTEINIWAGVHIMAWAESEIFPYLFMICLNWEKQNAGLVRRQVDWICDLST
jgi:hypothetical protein